MYRHRISECQKCKWNGDGCWPTSSGRTSFCANSKHKGRFGAECVYWETNIDEEYECYGDD